MSMPRVRFTVSMTSWMALRFFRPSRSILRRDSSSTSVITTWEVRLFSPPSPFSIEVGRKFSTLPGATTSPQACCEAWRLQPSRVLATSMTRATSGSSLYRRRSSGFISNALESVIFGALGTSFARLFAQAGGYPITRATSLMTILAAIVPNVTMRQTDSAPYFLVM